MTTATLKSKPLSTRKERIAWYLYDFGNSSYAAVVLLAVYSAYFQGTVVGGAEGSRLWGMAVGIAMLFVAVTSPVLGAIADYSGAKKKFLLFYTVVTIFFTASLFFVEPGRVILGMALFILAEIGYRSSQVFYNGLLPEIANPDEMGRISGNGWAIGNIGGILSLLLVLPLIVLQQQGVIRLEGTVVVRLTLVITAVFFAISTIPIFIWLPERAQGKPLPPGENYFSVAVKQLGHTIRTARRYKEFLKFMLAFLIYNDGVIMALNFAAIIGAVLFGLDQQGLIIFIVIVQVANVFGAYIFGVWMDQMGGKRSLIISILMMITAIVWLYLNQTQNGFYMIGVLAGVGMAGLQSVSRSMVAIFTPPGQSAEFYGFFAVAGRTSSFVGPTIYGIVAYRAALWYQNQGQAVALAEQSGQRAAILSIAIFFVIGLILLSRVNEKRARTAARELHS